MGKKTPQTKPFFVILNLFQNLKNGLFLQEIFMNIPHDVIVRERESKLKLSQTRQDACLRFHFRCFRIVLLTMPKDRSFDNLLASTTKWRI